VCVAGVVAWCALVAVAAPLSARAAGCPPLDYQAALAAARTALISAPPTVAVAHQEVTALLRTDPGRAVALQPIVEDLSVEPPDTADAAQRLQAMSSTLAYPTGSTCVDDGTAAHGTLRGVYASPAFRHLDDVQQPSFLTSVLGAIASWISTAGSALGQVGGIVLILLIAAVVMLIVVRRWRAAAATRAQATVETAPSGDDPDAEWRAADAAAAAGDFREAVRRAFRSALLDVADRGHVRVDAAWTTRELLERCNAAGDVLVALAGAAALFDHAWYSGAAVTRADWDLAVDRCGSLRHLARGRRVPVR
jgi:hypothetical protein